MRSLAAPTIKSLIFVIVTVLATTVLALSVASSDLGDRTTYKARFTDVAGLNTGDGVRIAGVRVGQVESIALADRRVAEVEFSVRADRQLPDGVVASIKFLNLVGQRYVDLGQGEGAIGRTLAPGATIPLERTSPALNMTELFRGFRPLMQALSPEDVNKLAGQIIDVLQGQGGTVEGLLASIGSLSSSIAAKDQVIGQLISNLSTVVDTVNSRDRQLSELIVTLRKLMGGLAADRRPIGDALQALGDLSTTTADFLRDSRQPLKADIAQLGRLANNLNADSPIIEQFLNRLPGKTALIGRTASYGSWANLFLCQASISGVTFSDGRTPPSGIPLTESRCKS